jgi:hypothetical protein
MCNEVCINGQYASNQSELCNLLGGELVFDIRGREDSDPKEWDDYVSKALEPNMCLCPIDLEKTANKYGYDLTDKDESGEYDPFTFYFVKNLPEGLRL